LTNLVKTWQFFLIREGKGWLWIFLACFSIISGFSSRKNRYCRDIQPFTSYWKQTESLFVEDSYTLSNKNASFKRERGAHAYKII